MNLRSVVIDSDTKSGRAFDLFINTLIIISLVSFSIETLPDLSSATKRFLDFLEVAVVIVFTIEYLLRFSLTRPPIKYIFSFYGFIDLAAILPFYLATSVDLRSVRVFRLLRLFRAIKLFRYNAALKRFGDAFIMVKHELIMFLIATVLTLYVASVGIYYFEYAAQPDQFRSIFHCLWWAITTLTTVGYGDMYPITVGGKIFTSFIVFIGLGVVAVPTGLIASAMTKVIQRENIQPSIKSDEE
jgi:voltage-gated potassium channel|tara:strand:- start:100 stop:828 length:729 start_codon:yes stop_codon:yes gene_type:complete